MTKSPWTIDVARRTATNASGHVIKFSRDSGVDAVWTVAQPVADKALAVAALAAWNNELNTAIDNLTAAGDALYGYNFINPLAKKLGTPRTTIQRWLSG